MDELIDGNLGQIFKFIKSFIKDFLYDKVCYSLGWFILRVVTVGKYPYEGLKEGLSDSEGADSIAGIVGFLIIIGLSYLLFS